MTLRKKWTNSALKNKKCSQCKKTFPRTDEYFYSTPHRSSIGIKNYTAHCIACDNKRCAEYKLKNQGKRTRQDIKYRESEHGYFKELWAGIRKSKHGNDFKSEQEFLDCWEKQKQIYGLNCPYFPWIQMTRVRGKGKTTDSNISKDRILSTMPYGPKNIMFVSWKANNEKGNVTPYVAARYLEFVEGNSYCKKVTEFELSCLNNLHTRRWGEDIDIIGSIIDNVKHDEELRNKYIDKLRELFYDDNMEH